MVGAGSEPAQDLRMLAVRVDDPFRVGEIETADDTDALGHVPVHAGDFGIAGDAHQRCMKFLVERADLARIGHTLGHWDDFEEPAFRKLLVNALFWALEEPYPVGQNIDKLLPAAVK